MYTVTDESYRGISVVSCTSPPGGVADPAESMLQESFSGQLRGEVSQFMEFELDDHSLIVLKRSVLFGRDGKPAAERNYGAAGALAGETRFVYTKSALLSEIRGTDATGRLTWRYAYAYDELSRTISESAFDSSGISGRVRTHTTIRDCSSKRHGSTRTGPSVCRTHSSTTVLPDSSPGSRCILTGSSSSGSCIFMTRRDAKP